MAVVISVLVREINFHKICRLSPSTITLTISARALREDVRMYIIDQSSTSPSSILVLHLHRHICQLNRSTWCHKSSDAAHASPRAHNPAHSPCHQTKRYTYTSS